MIFAELEYQKDYSEMHAELVTFARSRFLLVESGIQGDSWIWILDGGEKVQIDTFTSMKHQVKSAKPGPHLQNVIEALRGTYQMKVYESPMPEGHE
jgi:hypothetical protein